MAVTNNATLLEDFEGAGPSFSSIGGGQGASVQSDIFLAGTQGAGRRTDNGSGGYWWNPGATADLSAAGTWVKFYVWITHYPVLTALDVRIGSATTAYESHTVTVSEYPPLGGWWPIWVQVDTGADTGTPDFTAADEFAQNITIGDVGGNAQNNIADQTHASVRPVMTWDAGSSGSEGNFGSFATTDETNALGTLVQFNGVYNLFANLQIGSATATAFISTGAVVLAPDFSHLGTGTTWLGVDVDLQNASTSVTWTDGVYGSSDPASASNKPDLLVTGTSGTADLSRQRFQGLRAAEFTSGVTCDDSVFDQCGALTATSAFSASNSRFLNSTSASSIIWDIASDPDTFLDGLAFTSDGSNHALELGTTSPLTVTLNGFSYSGYAGTNGSTGNEAVWVRRTTGTVTINVNGGDTPTIRTDGATVVVNNTVTVSVTVVDQLGAPIENAAVVVMADSSTTGDLPDGDSVSISRSGTTATATHTAHGLSTGAKVNIEGTSSPFLGIHTITVTGVNTYTFTVANAGATTAPGTPIATAVVLSGLTNASGVISTSSYSYTVDQGLECWAKKSSAAPYYAFQPFTGTIGSTGLSLSVPMALDQ